METSSKRALYRSRVAMAWLARDSSSLELSSTYRRVPRYRLMIRIDWDTEITG